VREYELMVIYSPELDEEALTAQIERTKDLIVGVGGEVEKVDQWGKRRFAYEIKNYTEGFYVVIDLKQKAERLPRSNVFLRSPMKSCVICSFEET